MAHPKDLTGKQFTRLTALRRTDEKAGGKYLWICLCQCGREVLVASSSLLIGNTRSCGCLKLEMARKRGRASKTHGHTINGTATTEWRLWHAMRNRCQNPSNKDFKYWGARGIKVCDRWQTFENFLADVGLKPHPSLSLDRIDNDGNYEPGNVRWATAKQQVANRRPRSEWS